MTRVVVALLLLGTVLLGQGQPRIRSRIGVASSSSGLSINWVQDTATPSDKPSYVGYLYPAGKDPSGSGCMLMFVNVHGASGIYSTNTFCYLMDGSGDWIDIGGTGSLANACPSSAPTYPHDRHPGGQLSIDPLRNRLWLMNGINVNCGAPVTDMWYLSLNSNPASDTWTEVTYSTIPNAPNGSPAVGSMVYDSVDDVLLLFTVTSGLNPKVFGFAPTDLNPIPGTRTAAQIATGAAADDWADITPAGSVYPTMNLYFNRAVYATAQGVVAIYSGGGVSPSNEFWTYTPSTKTFTQKFIGATPPVYTGPDGPRTYPFVYNANTGTFIYRQTTNTGSPRDWECKLATDVCSVITSTGGSPVGQSGDMVMEFDPVTNKLFAWMRNSGTGLPDIWIGTVSGS